MISYFDPLRELTMAAMILRMTLACICGGIIGIERDYKRRPAGMRTHILICLGAAVTTLTSQYLSFVQLYHTDIARLGAQVIAGVGFIGAGTIIVTKSQRVKGLTTAAGLWATAIVGLTIGAGFYEAGIDTTLLVLLAEMVLAKMEYRLYKNSSEINVLVKYSDRTCLNELLHMYQEKHVGIQNVEIFRPQGEQTQLCALFSLRMPKHYQTEELVKGTFGISGVFSVEEI